MNQYPSNLFSGLPVHCIPVEHGTPLRIRNILFIFTIYASAYEFIIPMCGFMEINEYLRDKAMLYHQLGHVYMADGAFFQFFLLLLFYSLKERTTIYMYI